MFGLFVGDGFLAIAHSLIAPIEFDFAPFKRFQPFFESLLARLQLGFERGEFAPPLPLFMFGVGARADHHILGLEFSLLDG